MPSTQTNRRGEVVISDESQPGDLEIKCPKCAGFVLAVEPPTHRVEQNVVFRIRGCCRRCSRRFTRRVTFNESGPNA